jgi:hypothetical protein
MSLPYSYIIIDSKHTGLKLKLLEVNFSIAKLNPAIYYLVRVHTNRVQIKKVGVQINESSLTTAKILQYRASTLETSWTKQK